MAKKDTESEEVTQAPHVEETPAKEAATKSGKLTPEPAKETSEAQVVKSQPPWLLIAAGVVATILVIVVVAAAWLSFHSMAHESVRYGLRQDGTNFGSGRQGGYYGSSGTRHMARPALTGVVTAVSGDTITVSGDGKQVTVKKTSSTTIGGDNTNVAVNDTVLIYGTTNSDGTVTATRIIIRNATMSSPADGAISPSV